MKYFDFKEYSSFLQTLDPYEFTLFGVVVGLLASDGLTTNEKNSIGNFIIEVGQTMLTVASQENLRSNLTHSYGHKDIEERLLRLERELNRLKTSRFNDE